QLYAVHLHVLNVDLAKQWPDITRKRDLGHNVFLSTGNSESEICKHDIRRNRPETSTSSHFFNGVNSSFSSVCTTNTSSSLAGSSFSRSAEQDCRLDSAKDSK